MGFARNLVAPGKQPCYKSDTFPPPPPYKVADTISNAKVTGTAPQSQKAVAAYLKGKQLLPFGFARHPTT